MFLSGRNRRFVQLGEDKRVADARGTSCLKHSICFSKSIQMHENGKRSEGERNMVV